ncbi:PorZ beta-propeller-like domain-containing protein [Arundinibacter roseus]|uniref:T9SS type A sorting domain-containing protein n=1 Tax=Arundinibacter roseus TaxID=2070510 RepID=A0A4V2XA45_9BACT|nr:T9SS type A sorting domain-containing protein [Arundinibacter roseus]TDB66055.1 T9SS type A sorting domain-containing protein [Arundinibacter roseus]
MKKLFLCFLGVIISCIGVFAQQEVPLNGWKTHFNYLSAQRLIQIQNRLYCSSYNSFFSFEPTTQNITLFSKLDGLHDTGISSLAWNPAQQLLLIGYRSGLLDLVSVEENGTLGEIREWTFLRDAANLPANRQIRDIVFREDLAYLATSFGVVVVDPARRQVMESYRAIGPNGTIVAVNQIAFMADSLFVLTPTGILGTSMNETLNRQFYENWRAVPFQHSPTSLAVFQEALYAGVAGSGIYRRSNRDWQLIYPNSGRRFSLRTHNDRLMATLDDRVLILNPQDQVTAFRHALLTSPQDALLDAANNLWVADAKAGLVGNFGGNFQSYSPLTADTTLPARTDSIILDRNGLSWTRLPLRLGGGILVQNPVSGAQRYLSVSPANGALPSSQINSLSQDRDGRIWFAADRGVGYFVPEGVLSGGNVQATYPIFGQRRLLSTQTSRAIVTEPGNRKWIGTNEGLYLFNPDGTRLLRHFTAVNSPLPSQEVRGLFLDEAEGQLFIETPSGMVSYRTDATSPSTSVESVLIFPNPVRPDYQGLVGFKNVPDQTVVKVTDLSGRLVFETRSQGGTASWDLRDYTGRRARGGIYLVLLTAADGSESKAGKLAIVE